jgi:hypothetical protein
MFWEVRLSLASSVFNLKRLYFCFEDFLLCFALGFCAVGQRDHEE